jgi:hypothetical protein
MQPPHGSPVHHPNGKTRRGLLAAGAGAAGGAVLAGLTQPDHASAAPGALAHASIVTTSPYTAAVNTFVPVDAPNGAVRINLPSAPADHSQIGVETVAVAPLNAHAVTVVCGGSDVFNAPGGAPTLTVSGLNQSVLLQYDAAARIWYVLAGAVPLSVKSGAAGLSSRVIVSSGQLSVINETLNALDAGFLIPGSRADQSAEMQAFLTAIGTAVGGNGGRGFIPAGVYHMGGAALAYPTTPCAVEGEAVSGYKAWEPNGGTILHWDKDVSAPPHTTYALSLGSANGPQAARNLSLVGPVRFPVGRPALLARRHQRRRVGEPRGAVHQLFQHSSGLG